MARRVLSVTFLLVLIGTAGAQDEARFAGTWKATTKVIGFDHQITLSQEGGQWKIESNYFKGDKVLGTAVGLNVKFANGALTYVQKYVKKPVASWKDNDDALSLRFKGDVLELSNVTKGTTIRQYERMGAPPTVAKSEPKADPPRKEEPKKPEPKKEEPKTPADELGFAGIWHGTYPGTNFTLVLRFTKKDSSYAVEGIVLDEAKKVRGRFKATDAKYLKTKEPYVALTGNWEPGPRATTAQPFFKAIAHANTLELVLDKKRSTLARTRQETLHPGARLCGTPGQPAGAYHGHAQQDGQLGGQDADRDEVYPAGASRPDAGGQQRGAARRLPADEPERRRQPTGGDHLRRRRGASSGPGYRPGRAKGALVELPEKRHGRGEQLSRHFGRRQAGGLRRRHPGDQRRAVARWCDRKAAHALEDISASAHVPTVPALARNGCQGARLHVGAARQPGHRQAALARGQGS
jgi:hypothetical protein